MSDSPPVAWEAATRLFRVAIVSGPTVFRKTVEHLLWEHAAFEAPLLFATPAGLASSTHGKPLDLVVLDGVVTLEFLLGEASQVCGKAYHVLMEQPGSLREVDRLYRHRVRGFLSPRMTSWEAEAVLMLSASGHGYVPRQLIDRTSAESPPDGGFSEPSIPLTPRETEVFARMDVAPRTRRWRERWEYRSVPSKPMFIRFSPSSMLNPVDKPLRAPGPRSRANSRAPTYRPRIHQRI